MTFSTSALILLPETEPFLLAEHSLLWSPLSNGTVLTWILRHCQVTPKPMPTVLLLPEPQIAAAQRVISDLRMEQITTLSQQADRASSLRLALRTLQPSRPDWILIHDPARPLVDSPLFLSVLEAAQKTGAATAAVPVKETIKQVYGEIIQSTLDRSHLWLLLSPQAFSTRLLSEALSAPIADHGYADEAELLFRLGHPVSIFSGSYNNIRITSPEDLLLAEALL